MSDQASDQLRPHSIRFEIGLATVWLPVFFCFMPIFVGFPPDLIPYFCLSALAYTMFRVSALRLQPLMGENIRCWKLAPLMTIAGVASSVAVYAVGTVFGWQAELVYFGIAFMTTWSIVSQLIF